MENNFTQKTKVGKEVLTWRIKTEVLGKSQQKKKNHFFVQTDNGWSDHGWPKLWGTFFYDSHY